MFFFEVLSLNSLNESECDLLPESSDPNTCLGQRENALFEEATRSLSKLSEKFNLNSKLHNQSLKLPLLFSVIERLSGRQVPLLRWRVYP